MTLRIRDAGDLIATLPLLLGFVPAESLVVVGLDRAGTMRPVFRIDLADVRAEQASIALCHTVAAHLARAGASRAVLVAFCDCGACEASEALARVRTHLADTVEVVDTWAVSRGRYRSPECADNTCCPETGLRVPPTPAAPLRGFAPRAHGVPSHAEAPSTRRRRASRAGDRAWQRGDRGSTRWRGERFEAWRRALAAAHHGALPTDAEAGKLAAGLRDIVVRDACVVDLIPGQGEVADALCEGRSSASVRDALAAILTPQCAVAPDPRQLVALTALCEHLAWIRPQALAPSMTLVGLARWWNGDEATAAHAIAQAVAHEPRYRLAELIQCAIDAHLPPGWLAAA